MSDVSASPPDRRMSADRRTPSCPAAYGRFEQGTCPECGRMKVTHRTNYLTEADAIVRHARDPDRRRTGMLPELAHLVALYDAQQSTIADMKRLLEILAAVLLVQERETLVVTPDALERIRSGFRTVTIRTLADGSQQITFDERQRTERRGNAVQRG